MGATREFWWDELEHTLLGDQPLPATLELEVAGVMHHWEFSAAATEAAVSPDTARAWEPWQDTHPSTRLTRACTVNSTICCSPSPPLSALLRWM